MGSHRVGLIAAQLAALWSCQGDPSAEVARTLTGPPAGTSDARALDARRLPDAAGAYALMLREPFATGPRRQLAEIYRREGFASVGSLFETSAEAVEKGQLLDYKGHVRGSWDCASVEDPKIIEDIAGISDLEEQAQRARELSISHPGSCEAALLAAWYDLVVLILDREPAPERAEVAIRVLVTGAEDGIAFPPPMLMDGYDIYFSLSRYLASHGDPVTGGVAAKRAEALAEFSPARMEVVHQQLEELRGIQRKAILEIELHRDAQP